MLKLYNTRSQQLEELKSQGDFITMYVCGITPYDTTHSRSCFYLYAADILIRLFGKPGPPCDYAQNVTDIDDDILRKARESGEDSAMASLGNEWTTHFIHDMQSLNVRLPRFLSASHRNDGANQSTCVQTLVDSGAGLCRRGLSLLSRSRRGLRIWQSESLAPAEMLEVANQRGQQPR